MACDMTEPCKFPSLDNQKRFLWTHKECGEFSSGTQLRKPDPFVRVSKQVLCFTALDEDGGDKRLVELELACEADVLHPQILFSLAIAAIAEAILIQTSVEQVPSSHRAAPKYWSPLTSGRSC